MKTHTINIQNNFKDKLYEENKQGYLDKEVKKDELGRRLAILKR